MEPVHFDRIARQFAGRLSRRQVLTTGGAGLAAGVLAAGIRSASAQDATPDAAAEGTSAPAMLFVQTYQSGTITPTEGVDGRYTLTLEQGHGQTIYFSDRPDRIVGADTTPRFLEGMPFPSDNPPNAALVVETAPGETDVAVVELFNPLYDPVTQGVTYEVEVLANWQAELGMEFTEAPTDLAALAPSFGSTQLFIDDCPNSDISCVSDEGGKGEKRGGSSPPTPRCAGTTRSASRASRMGTPTPTTAPGTNTGCRSATRPSINAVVIGFVCRSGTGFSRNVVVQQEAVSQRRFRIMDIRAWC